MAAAWLTWRFALKEMSVGALQAVGTIVVYALVLWLLLRHYISNAELRDALYMRAPVLLNEFGAGDATTPQTDQAATTVRGGDWS